MKRKAVSSNPYIISEKAAECQIQYLFLSTDRVPV